MTTNIFENEPPQRTSAEEWLEQIKMILPFTQILLGTGGPPRVAYRPGHAAVVFRNDLGEALRIMYDDGQHCDELAEELLEGD